MTDLVAVLLQQHQAGRKLTAQIQRLATPVGLSSEPDRRKLIESMQKFIRMYEPHSAREDTVLFVPDDGRPQGAR
jgi:hemerythrin-like domain-containing protein